MYISRGTSAFNRYLYLIGRYEEAVLPKLALQVMKRHLIRVTGAYKSHIVDAECYAAMSNRQRQRGTTTGTPALWPGIGVKNRDGLKSITLDGC